MHVLGTGRGVVASSMVDCLNRAFRGRAAGGRPRHGGRTGRTWVHRATRARARRTVFAALAVAAVLVPQASGAGLYWGAWMSGEGYGRGNVMAPWDPTTLSLFEQHAGKKASIIHIGQAWKKCTSSGCSYQSFDSSALNLIRQHGSIPLLTWQSWAQSKGANQPDFQLADIINGNHDSYIRSWATAAKNWGQPFFVRFDPEMNLASARFPYQETKNGNQLGQYVKMWQHVVNIFNNVGAKNVTWVWCPNREYSGSQKPLSGLYPGGSYVGWSCLDGYNWGTNPNGSASGWNSFDTVFAATYSLVTGTIAPGKPMMLGEVACTEYGGNKASWLTDMFAKLPTSYPKVKALVWFNKPSEGMDWPIESSASAQTAFAKGISASTFVANTLGSLASSPIPPP